MVKLAKKSARKRQAHTIHQAHRSVRQTYATQHRSTRKSRQMPMAQNFGLFIIIAAVAVTVFAVLINIFFSSSKIVENRLHVLARIYYEDYYYPNLTENGSTDTLAEYSEYGLPTVKLNQLLSFNNHQYADYKVYFVNDRYTCNLVGTSVKYYPVAPYGPHDYNVDYKYDCSHIQSDKDKLQNAS